MKYSLAVNAFSSLSIAIDAFKQFYYKNELTQSEFEEKVKIGIIFLENSIELMLKAILSTDNELIIFKEPDCKTIKRAKELTNEDYSLYDILIQNKADVHTISYCDTVEIYNKKYHNSNKLKVVLDNLGAYRNRFTHFGIEFSSYDEILRIFINTFDIIYNYLYPQLTELDEIGDYFTSDYLIVDTLHGSKYLFDEDMIYNNVLDFLDELLSDGNRYLFDICYQNKDNEIDIFESFYVEAINDKKLKFILNKYNTRIEINDSSFYNKKLSLYFSLFDNNDDEVMVMFRYLPFYNASIYFDDGGMLLFIVLFNDKTIFLYEKEAFYPDFDESDKDNQWEKDFQDGLCKKLVLSKNNLIKAIEKIIIREYNIE